MTIICGFTINSSNFVEKKIQTLDLFCFLTVKILNWLVGKCFHFKVTIYYIQMHEQILNILVYK